MGSKSRFAWMIIVALSGSVVQAAPVESFKLHASDAAASDEFGYAVAISGSTAIIGSIGGNAEGVESGAAYLFDAQTGRQYRKLTPSDASQGDVFGFSVAVSGSLAVVGAQGYDGAGSSSGAAYVFDTNTGSQLRKLSASDASAGDRFGHSVAISGNLAVMGAYGDAGSGSNSGSAYVFDLATGDELYKLTASDAAADDFFGWPVAIDGTTAVIGAHGNDDVGSSSGSAYVFDLTTGNQTHKLTASDAFAGDWFGRSVAISGDLAIVGARNDDDGGVSSGSAYVFDLTTGQQVFKLNASDASLFDHFGSSVAISGNTAIVGSPRQSEGGSNSGAAYVFDLTTGDQLAKIKASDVAPDDWFGFSVALSGSTAVIGASLNDDMGGTAGATYIYDNVPEPALGFLLMSVIPLLRTGIRAGPE